jgi:hypothetical protein
MFLAPLPRKPINPASGASPSNQRGRITHMPTEIDGVHEALDELIAHDRTGELAKTLTLLREAGIDLNSLAASLLDALRLPPRRD